MEDNNEHKDFEMNREESQVVETHEENDNHEEKLEHSEPEKTESTQEDGFKLPDLPKAPEKKKMKKSTKITLNIVGIIAAMAISSVASILIYSAVRPPKVVTKFEEGKKVMLSGFRLTVPDDVMSYNQINDDVFSMVSYQGTYSAIFTGHKDISCKTLADQAASIQTSLNEKNTVDRYTTKEINGVTYQLYNIDFGDTGKSMMAYTELSADVCAEVFLSNTDGTYNESAFDSISDIIKTAEKM